VKTRLVILAGLIVAVGLFSLARSTRKAESVPPANSTIGAAISTIEPVTVAARARPVEAEAPTTAAAQLMRSDQSRVDARSVDGEFECVHVAPNEILRIRLAPSGFDPRQPIRIDADHGGSLNRQLGPALVSADPNTGEFEFQYAVGGHSGRYSLHITQGTRQELMTFFVGPEPPAGQAGPARRFDPDPT
jgi:hypothetical protein